MQNLSLKSIPEERRVSWLAFLFVFLFAFFEVYTLKIGYADYAAYLLLEGDLVQIGFALFVTIFPLFLTFKVVEFLFGSSWIYKIPALIFFGFSLFVEYGYQRVLGRFLKITDFEAAVNTTAYQKLAAVELYINFTPLIPLFALLICLIFIKPPKIKYGFKEFLTISALVVVFFGGTTILSGLFTGKEFPLLSVNAFCRIGSELLIKGSNANSAVSATANDKKWIRRPVTKPESAEKFKPKNNIVMVIDESVRGDHLSLNGYARPTTPFLDSLANEKILHNWGIAASASTGSRFTYNTFIVGLTPDELPDPTNVKLYESPSVFQYAKAMNYSTYFFEGQMDEPWSGIPDDQTYIDKWFPVSDFVNKENPQIWDIDNQIAKKINKIISSSSGNFIFVFKHGSHFPYNFNFPEDQQTWQPSFSSKKEIGWISPENVPLAVNAYDNSLKYNIDSFFRNLVDDYRKIPNQTVIIYTGDHGQTLFENGLMRLHGGSTKSEATVPLFIIGKLPVEPDTNYKASHFNIFPTILDLFEYPQDLRENKNALSLLKAKQADSRPRFFNPDLGEKVPFD